LLLRRGSVLAQFCLFPNKLRPPFRLAATVASFADHFTTRELTFTRATGEDLTLTHQLCIADGSADASPICLKSQLAAVLRQTAAAATPTSVPHSPSNMREAAPPISVSSSTPNLSNSEQATPSPDETASPPAWAMSSEPELENATLEAH
jgi:hypothetical protein